MELRALKRPLVAQARLPAYSIGDFGVVALFGNDNFRTLPFICISRSGSYRSGDGAVTARRSAAAHFWLFTLIEKLPGRRRIKLD